MASSRGSLAPCRACCPDEIFRENSSKKKMGPCCDGISPAIDGKIFNLLILRSTESCLATVARREYALQCSENESSSSDKGKSAALCQSLTR